MRKFPSSLTDASEISGGRRGGGKADNKEEEERKRAVRGDGRQGKREKRKEGEQL